VAAILYPLAVSNSTHAIEKQAERHDSSTPSAQPITLSPGAVLYKGLWEAWNEDFDAALRDLTLAIERGADKAKALAGRGWAHMARKQYDEALRDFSESLKLEPQQPWVLERRALLYLARGEIDKAAHDFLWAENLNHTPTETLAVAGMIHLANGNPEAAVEACLQAIDRDDSDRSVGLILACAYTALHKWNEALQEADRLSANDPDQPIVLILKAQIYMASGDYGKAIAIISSAIHAHPQALDLYLLRGQLGLQTGRFEKALEDFKKALKGSNNLRATVGLAFAHSRLGHWDRAMEVVRPAEHEPELARHVAYLRGYCLARKRCDLKAIAQFTKALKLLDKPSPPAISRTGTGPEGTNSQVSFRLMPLTEQLNPVAVFMERAYAYARLRRFREAVADLDSAISMKPSEYELHLDRAKLYLEMGDAKNAIDDCNKALELNPKAPKAYFLRGRSHVENGNPNLALADLAVAGKLEPRNVEVIRQQVLAHHALNQIDLALEDCSRILCFEPQSAIGYFGRGVCYLEKEEWLRAIADLNQATALDPSYVEALLKRSYAYQMVNNTESALSDLNEAIRLAPANEELYQARAIANFRAKRYGDALEDIEKFQKLGGTDLQISQVRDWIVAHCRRVVRASDTMPRFEAVNPPPQRGGDEAASIEGLVTDIKESLAVPDSKDKPAKMKGRTPDSQNGELSEVDKSTVQTWTERLKKCPTDIASLRQRGALYARLDKWELARADFSAAVKLSPKDAELLCQRAHAQARLKQFSQAIGDCETALPLANDRAVVCNELAWLLATAPDAKLRDGKRAIRLALEACQASYWANGVYVDTLAAAYAESGDFPKAIQYAQKARDLYCPGQAKEADARLELYKRGRAYRL
jgi:tetratricopeptide (TPR) repeat protein